MVRCQIRSKKEIRVSFSFLTGAHCPIFENLCVNHPQVFFWFRFFWPSPMAETQYAGILAKKNRHGIFDSRWVCIDFQSLKMSYWKTRDSSFKGEPLSYVRIRSIKDIDWTETLEKGATVRRRSLIGGGVKFVMNMAENHEPKQYTWRASTGPDALVWKEKLEKALALAAEAPKEEENTEEYKIGSRQADSDSDEEPPPKQSPPPVAAPTVAPPAPVAVKEGDALVEELQKKQKELNLEGAHEGPGSTSPAAASVPTKPPPAAVQGSSFEEF